MKRPTLAQEVTGLMPQNYLYSQPGADIQSPQKQYEQLPEELRTSYANTDLEGKTAQQQRTLVAFLSSVNQRIKNMAQEYRTNKNAKFQREKFSEVTEQQAKDIMRLTGINVSGFKNGVNTNTFNHIERRHGINGAADQSMADLNDVARIPYIIANYDSIDLVYDENGNIQYSKEYRDKKNNPAPLVKYTKKVDGSVYVVEAVPDSEYSTLWVETAYMNKKTGGIPASDAFTPNSTSENELVPSPVDTSVSQDTPGVNSQYMQNPGTYSARPTLAQEITGLMPQSTRPTLAQEVTGLMPQNYLYSQPGADIIGSDSSQQGGNDYVAQDGNGTLRTIPESIPRRRGLGGMGDSAREAFEQEGLRRPNGAVQRADSTSFRYQKAEVEAYTPQAREAVSELMAWGRKRTTLLTEDGRTALTMQKRVIHSTENRLIVE